MGEASISFKAPDGAFLGQVRRDDDRHQLRLIGFALEDRRQADVLLAQGV